MLFGHLLTGRAQIFSDVRTYWSPEAIERVTGRKVSGTAAGGLIHLINSGSTTLDGTGEMTDEDGNPVMKQFWDITGGKMLERDALKGQQRISCPCGIFGVTSGGQGGNFSTGFSLREAECRGKPMSRDQPFGKGGQGSLVAFPDLAGG